MDGSDLGRVQVEVDEEGEPEVPRAGAAARRAPRRLDAQVRRVAVVPVRDEGLAAGEVLPDRGQVAVVGDGPQPVPHPVEVSVSTHGVDLTTSSRTAEAGPPPS